MRRTTLRKWTLTLIIVLILIPSGTAFQKALIADQRDITAESATYLPLVRGLPSEFEISDAWMGNADGIALSTFLPGAPLEYTVSGVNQLSTPTTVALSWSQIGPCGSGQVITKTLELDPGLWEDVYPSNAPDCIGVYTATVKITGTNFTSSQSVGFRVDTASVIISDKHGFDRCNMPSIAEMQTWWDSSPYYVANVYLGGISYDNTTGCSNEKIDINWMQSVADQGWTFLLAWVGPQSPCSGYSYKMSYYADDSYQEGRDEAELAIQTAADIGLPSSIIIHYDIEGYGNENNTACRAAVDAFVQGWTERLHELGAQSGAYGSPCNSHISDWADNDPAPDDVWIAHWIYQNYNPFVTVWDVACLSNDLWPDHQRARQYAGDHTETWGGLSLRIDSNVLDGAVVALGIKDTITTSQEIAGPQVAPQPLDLGVLLPDQGWVLLDDRLLITQDNGVHWDDLTPQGTSGILDVHFMDPSQGLLVYQNEYGLRLLSTSDGGASWHSVPLPLSVGGVVAASLEFTDAETGKLYLKLSTGSSFNQVREFTTQDGGQTWQDGNTLSMPIDESLPGLLPGDGNLPEGTILVDWYGSDYAWALAQQGTCQGVKYPIWTAAPPDMPPWQCELRTELWMTVAGGRTWQEITPD